MTIIGCYLNIAPIGSEFPMDITRSFTTPIFTEKLILNPTLQIERLTSVEPRADIEGQDVEHSSLANMSAPSKWV